MTAKNVCYGITENCSNPTSFNSVCVCCNNCGRFNEDKVIEVTQEQMRELQKWVLEYGRQL